MVTHNSDCYNCDFRVNKVPAADWPENASRPIFLYKSDYPQVVTPSDYYRGETWVAANLEGTPEQLADWSLGTQINGYIPQVCIIE